MTASKTAPPSSPAKKTTKRKATPRPKRKVWKAPPALRSENFITGIPVMAAGDDKPTDGEFHVALHKIPPKGDFDNLATYWRFRAAVVHRKAVTLIAAANEFAARAEKLEKLGTPEQQAAKRKLERAAKRMAQMREEAKAAGIDPDTVLEEV
jgi:hypothetical protein